MGTPPSAARPPLPPLLLLLLLLPLALPTLLATAASTAETPFVLPSAPKVINATNVTLTFVADIGCPPICDINFITWQIKPWMKKKWSPGEVSSANLSFTFTRLVPGVYYDVRGLIKRDDDVNIYTGELVPMARALTCTNDVPAPTAFWEWDRNETHMEVGWDVPRDACVSVRFVLERAPFEQRPLAVGCPPPFQLDPQPHVQCRPRPTHQCSAVIDAVPKDEKQYIGVSTIDWLGRCSEKDWFLATPEREHPLGGVQVTLIVCVVLTAIFLAGLIPLLYKLKKRLAGRGAAGQRFTFSRMKPNNATPAAAAAAAATAQAPLEIDRDGYLLSDPQTRPADAPSEQPQI